MTIGAAVFWQTEVLPEMVAVGNGFTLIVALPVWAWEQAVELPSCTFSRLYVNVPAVDVGAVTVTLFPLEVVINRFAPPLTL